MKTPKNKKSLPVLPSPVFASLQGCKGGRMKHRTAARGGSKNTQAAFRAEIY